MADKPLDLSGVPSLDRLLREARRLGCDVSGRKATGEVRVSHPDLPDRVNLNARRKDGSRVLITMLRRLQDKE